MTLLPQPSVTLGLMFGQPSGLLLPRHHRVHLLVSCASLSRTWDIWLCLPTAARTDLWEPVGHPQAGWIHTRRGMVPGVGQRQLSTWKGAWFHLPWVGVGPASSQTQLEAERRW